MVPEQSRPNNNLSPPELLVLSNDLTVDYVQIILLEASNGAPLLNGITYSGIIKIPPWPLEEKDEAPRQTECFILVANAEIRPSTDGGEVANLEVDEYRQALVIAFTEDCSGGELNFKVTPNSAGQVSIKFVSFEGEPTGIYDPENRKIWRVVEVTA